MSNMYFFQLYDVPKELDILRSIPAGILLIVIALVILNLALREFDKNNEDPIPTTSSKLIIDKNIYSYSRNPMYLGLLIMQVGIGMLLSIVPVSYTHLTLPTKA